MEVEININGKITKLDIEPDDMLLDVLRERLGLYGTKGGCREGECGSCTVLVNDQPVNSCIFPAIKAHQCNVFTIEGVANSDNPHPILNFMAELNAAQCGYCTPGFIMSALALLSENKNPTIEDIKDAITGNLCRCTGYSKIIQAIKQTAEAQKE